MSAKDQGKPSKVETVKLGSDYLLGGLREELATESPCLSEESMQLLKHHGSYQQDDRDLRARLRHEGKDKAYQFMVRSRVPGGRVTAEQFLAHDRLARELGDGSLRITTRQAFQMYGILKQDLPSVIRGINESLLSTLAACGDVVRNVLCCPAPLHQDSIRRQMLEDCDQVVAHFAPRTSSYWDLWLNGERVSLAGQPSPGPSLVPTAGDDEVEPIYGKTYMPRKFKFAFALPEDNCTDAFANDIGLLAIVEGGELIGYNVLVGGGMGTTPSSAKTAPMVTKILAFAPRGEFLRVAEAILKVQRDYGNRGDRKRARLKYVVHDWGIAHFRQEVESYLGGTLQRAVPMPALEVDDHMGWHEQGDGKLWLGLPIENGRLKDRDRLKNLTALRRFFQDYGTPARLTCQQSILLVDLEPSSKGAIERHFRDHGVPLLEDVSTVRRWSMACPALPTCGLAVTESERALPGLMDMLEVEMERLGLAEERVTIHMTGCPNGCARPYNCDIGLVGRAAAKTEEGGNEPGSYTIFLGGRAAGDRLGLLYKDYVPFDQLVPELVAVLTRFRQERRHGEPFGDFWGRVGAGDAKGDEEAAASREAASA